MYKTSSEGDLVSGPRKTNLENASTEQASAAASTKVDAVDQLPLDSPNLTVLGYKFRGLNATSSPKHKKDFEDRSLVAYDAIALLACLAN